MNSTLLSLARVGVPPNLLAVIAAWATSGAVVRTPGVRAVVVRERRPA